MHAGMSGNCPYSPEADLTPEARLDAIAEILLDANPRDVRRAQSREDAQMQSAKDGRDRATASLDEQGEQSRHGAEVNVPAAASAPT